MPLLSALHLPEPNNWQDLEIICADLWRAEWEDATTQRHGKAGQAQQGVDISGTNKQGERCGIQCKCIEPKSILTEREIDKEAKKANSFEPAIKHLLIVTTGKKDAPIERYCRKLSDANKEKGLFDVIYIAWSEVCALLQAHHPIAKIHYPFAIYSKKPVVLNNETSLDWKKSPFSFTHEPFINPRIVEELQGYISDRSPTVVSVDLLEANKSNRFFGDFSVEETDGVPLVRYSTPTREGFRADFFDYRSVAVTSSGIYIVRTREGGGGSGVFENLLFFSLQEDTGIFQKGYEVISKQRVMLKILGFVSLGDRYYGRVQYSRGVLKIGGVPKIKEMPYAERKAFSIKIS